MKSPIIIPVEIRLESGRMLKFHWYGARVYLDAPHPVKTTKQTDMVPA